MDFAIRTLLGSAIGSSRLYSLFFTMVVSIASFSLLLFSLFYYTSFVVSLHFVEFPAIPIYSSLPASTLVSSYPTSSTPSTSTTPSFVYYNSIISETSSRYEPSISSSPVPPTLAFSPSTSLSPTSSPNPQIVEEMHTVLQRRIDFIIASATQVSQIPSWQINYLTSHHTFS